MLSFAVASMIASSQGWSGPLNAPPGSPGLRVTACEFIGEVTLSSGYEFQDTEVGGLSAIAYDASRNLYLALSDDRSKHDPARFYSLTIDLSDGHLDAGDIAFTGVTRLRRVPDTYFPKGSIDPEGIALSPNGAIFISSEGDASKSVAPFVGRFDRSGIAIRQLPLDTKFLPDDTSGIRDNLAFESLTISPDGRSLYTAVENALLQDGPEASFEEGSRSRILQYDLETGREVGERVYEVGPVADIPALGIGFGTNGLAELLALDDRGTFLALERSYTLGKGFRVRLYQVQAQDAENVSGRFSLQGNGKDVRPVRKELLLDFGDLVEMVDNLEGMALGPVLPDGRRSLIVVSDNNFSAGQFTQFIGIALSLEDVPRPDRP